MANDPNLMDTTPDNNICMRVTKKPVEEEACQHPILHGLVLDPYILIDVVTTHSEFYASGYKRCSIPAPQQPYKLPEPKNGTIFDDGLMERHEVLRPMISAALEFFKRDYDGEYCRKRYVFRQDEDCKPMASDLAGEKADAVDGELCGYYISLGEPDIKVHCKQLKDQMSLQTIMRLPGTIYELHHLENTADDVTDVYNVIVANDDRNWKHLTFPEVGTYAIPPMSSFLFGSFNESFYDFDRYSAASRSRRSGGFDLLVIDPPWPNRSVGRAKAYEMFNPYDLFKLKRRHIRRGGVVAIWVTNKTRWIDFVINKLFPALGVDFVAKWIWVKVTEDGEPIFNLESVSRKPYEVLILGKLLPKQGERRQDDAPLPLEDKVIVGVPELHSRKPCLKHIIYPYIARNPRVCEIFARNLVEGWFSWGDEVMKGNHIYNWNRTF